MKTTKSNMQIGFKEIFSVINKNVRYNIGFKVILIIFLITFICCKENSIENNKNVITPTINVQYTITQAISDEAQLNTIAFDGLAFLTGNLGSQSFLPPGKVADYSGFQYLRDNDPTQLGHNTSFVTIISFNILNILTKEQINMFVESAQYQIDLINEFALRRFPLLKAYRRLKENDIITGTTGLDKEAVMFYTANLYKLDGQISYDRAKIFGKIINSLSDTQKAKIDALKALNGIGNWNGNLANPLEGLNLSKDVNVAVMTYASEIYAWYAGNVESDVYFCPERHGTYFGSFYLKDWPAMGNPNYTIDETLTANAGQKFLEILNTTQESLVRKIVDQQRSALLELVEIREAVSIELRKFMITQTADSSTVLNLSARYGELDGEIGYYYATVFSNIYYSLSVEQKEKLLTLADNLGYINPTGAFLYSQPIAMPEIINTDFLFK